MISTKGVQLLFATQAHTFALPYFVFHSCFGCGLDVHKDVTEVFCECSGAVFASGMDRSDF